MNPSKLRNATAPVALPLDVAETSRRAVAVLRRRRLTGETVVEAFDALFPDFNGERRSLLISAIEYIDARRTK